MSHVWRRESFLYHFPYVLFCFCAEPLLGCVVHVVLSRFCSRFPVVHAEEVESFFSRPQTNNSRLLGVQDQFQPLHNRLY